MEPVLKIFTVSIIILSLGLECWGGEHEYRLTKYLLSNYEESVRPVANSSLPLVVEFGVSLHQIVDVDEKNQILTTNCWLTQIWNDSHLTWNYTDFGGIRAIRLPYKKVWRPDIILYNNADSQYNTATINTNVIVSYTGEVVWLSHGMFKSSCDVSVEYFPFDIQDCQMKWAAWSYDGYSLDLRDQNINSSGDMSNYQVNGEFILEDFRSDYHMKYYSCCQEPYPDITYTIRIRRRPLFYVFNLILPCVLINGIALLVFYVPSESGEKVTLGISALLSMTVFLMTIRESLPPTEKTPLIILYYGVSICLVSFASAMAVVTLNIHYRGLRGAEVPDYIKTIFLGFFGRIVFVQATSDYKRKKREQKAAVIQEVNGTFRRGAENDLKLEPGIFNRPYSPIFPTISTNGRNHGQTPPNGSQPTHLHTQNTCDLLSDPNVDYLEPKYQTVLDKVSASIDTNESRYMETDFREQHALEWKQVALVIDRLLLWLFFTAMAISSLVILTQRQRE